MFPGWEFEACLSMGEGYVTPLCTGGIDIPMTSQEVFPCVGVLGFLRCSKMKGKMLSVVRLIQKGQDHHVLLVGPIVPMEFFGGSPVDFDFAIDCRLCDGSTPSLFSSLQPSGNFLDH